MSVVCATGPFGSLTFLYMNPHLRLKTTLLVVAYQLHLIISFMLQFKLTVLSHFKDILSTQCRPVSLFFFCFSHVCEIHVHMCTHVLDVCRYMCMCTFAQVCGDPKLICFICLSHSALPIVGLTKPKHPEFQLVQGASLLQETPVSASGVRDLWVPPCRLVYHVVLTHAHPALYPLLPPPTALFVFLCETSFRSPAVLGVGPSPNLLKMLILVPE